MQILLLYFNAFCFPEIYQDLLHKYVDSTGYVDYAAWKEDPSHASFVQALSSAVPPQDDTAYWINMYNALTIQLIIENYPLQSIRDLAHGKVWSTHEFSLSTGRYTLDAIEHKILRPRKDPRIHAAINCASVGCPPLWNKPYTEQHLSQDLDLALERWFASNAFHKTDSGMHISKIFLWYADDFPPSPLSFLRQHRPNMDWPKTENISYMEYDWSLNEKKD